MPRRTTRHRGSRIAGIDEAGRGPLAGPVVAAAAILPEGAEIDGLTDSKQLDSKERERVYLDVLAAADAWSVAWADVAEIDSINILQATMLAMRRSLLGLSIRPRLVLVDGNRLPSMEFFGVRFDAEAIVGGDLSEPAISAASVIAKVTRDRMMQESDRLYPEYGFAQHKGYCTRRHLAALQQSGPCEQHRRSFAPVRNSLAQGLRRSA